jgi:hypothetical protein
MSTVCHYPHILEENDQSPRLERWPRVRVAQIVMDHLGYAWSAEDISRQYPHLSLSEIHSALAYYYDHQENIDREIQIESRRADASHAAFRHSPLAIKLAALAH